MPIYKTKEEDYKIGIWKISETIEELEALICLNSIDKLKYETLLTAKRKKEWLATRLLIQHLLDDSKISIIYDKHRKPSLSNGYKLSISHTNDYIAVIVHSKKEVGIDIQVEKTNIEKGAYSFLTATELEQISAKDSLQKAHLYWCAKEALYKRVGDSSLNIYSHFSILNFELKEKGSFNGKINETNEEVELFYQLFEAFYLVWTI